MKVARLEGLDPDSLVASELHALRNAYLRRRGAENG